MGSLNLLARRVGEIPTNDGNEMAALLKEHWGAIFFQERRGFQGPGHLVEGRQLLLYSWGGQTHCAGHHSSLDP
eukprot:3726627-Heterocapsa_arctica.AAC.1